MKKPIPLRDLRGAAEAAARDYADRHRGFDRLIETRIMASHDQKTWKVIALVDDPDKVSLQTVSFGASHIKIMLPVFGAEWKEHEVVVRRRKP